MSSPASEDLIIPSATSSEVGQMPSPTVDIAHESGRVMEIPCNGCFLSVSQGVDRQCRVLEDGAGCLPCGDQGTDCVWPAFNDGSRDDVSTLLQTQIGVLSANLENPFSSTATAATAKRKRTSSTRPRRQPPSQRKRQMSSSSQQRPGKRSLPTRDSDTESSASGRSPTPAYLSFSEEMRIKVAQEIESNGVVNWPKDSCDACIKDRTRSRGLGLGCVTSDVVGEGRCADCVRLGTRCGYAGKRRWERALSRRKGKDGQSLPVDPHYEEDEGQDEIEIQSGTRVGSISTGASCSALGVGQNASMNGQLEPSPPAPAPTPTPRRNPKIRRTYNRKSKAQVGIATAVISGPLTADRENTAGEAPGSKVAQQPTSVVSVDDDSIAVFMAQRAEAKRAKANAMPKEVDFAASGAQPSPTSHSQLSPTPTSPFAAFKAILMFVAKVLPDQQPLITRYVAQRLDPLILSPPSAAGDRSSQEISELVVSFLAELLDMVAAGNDEHIVLAEMLDSYSATAQRQARVSEAAASLAGRDLLSASRLLKISLGMVFKGVSATKRFGVAPDIRDRKHEADRLITAIEEMSMDESFTLAGHLKLKEALVSFGKELYWLHSQIPVGVAAVGAMPSEVEVAAIAFAAGKARSQELVHTIEKVLETED